MFSQINSERPDESSFEVMDFEEFKQTYTEITDIQEFVLKFIANIVVCDPLNRPILSGFDESDSE